MSAACNQFSLFLCHDSPAYFALIEANYLKQYINSTSENVRNKFILSVFNLKKGGELHLLSDIVDDLLTNGGEVKRALVDNFHEVGFEECIPDFKVHIWQLQEVCCDYDVQAIAMIDI